MRRSVRDAIVGFTVIGGIIGFAAAALWLRGVRLGSSYWTLTARFNDAAGLAERSPVTYRGILVGSVRSIAVTPEAVVAELEIDKGDLILPLPVTATVASGSLLGGDAQVALVSRGIPLPKDAPLPRAADCRVEEQHEPAHRLPFVFVQHQTQESEEAARGGSSRSACTRDQSR